MSIAAHGRFTEAGIARWKAEAARRAAVDEVARQIERIVSVASKEGIADRTAQMMDDAARRLFTPARSTTYADIENRLCRVFGVTPEAICGRSRNVPRVTLCRQAIMYWAMRRTLLSPAQIGKRMGGRDHSTVYYGIDAYPKKRAAQGRYLRSLPRDGVFRGRR
ncbi:helix-turn-helix domain-containing protein [Aquamicrobium segne]|uniref:Helix-turn-helix domain-containing protein n=1 Tax=Aquamicrobium segne TaxID=469547 RepID=A0ABW0GUR2_9HYPH